MATTDPLDLVTLHADYTANPGDFDYALYGKGKAGEAYDRYLERREVLDRAFWEEVKGLPAARKAAISSGMRKADAYKEMSAVHLANVVEKGQ
jgi:hypothetical protein